MKKGQAAIEFIFLVLVVVVYIVTVTMPLVDQTKNITRETASLSIANNETQKFVNHVQELSLLGTGSKQTFTILIPEDTIFRCEDTNVGFITTIKQKPFPQESQCIENDTNTLTECTKIFLINGATIDCGVKELQGPTKAIVILKKMNDQNIQLSLAG